MPALPQTLRVPHPTQHEHLAPHSASSASHQPPMGRLNWQRATGNTQPGALQLASVARRHLALTGQPAAVLVYAGARDLCCISCELLPAPASLVLPQPPHCQLDAARTPRIAS